MQKLTRALTVVAMAGLLGSSTTAQGQRDFFRKSDYRLPFDQRLRFEVGAPIIVLGRVTEVNHIGKPKRSQGDPRILVQLTRLTVDVEEVIKGTVRANTTEIDLFTYSSENKLDLGVPRYIPTVGQLRIYFLRPLQNAYRSVGDVTNYNLSVQSGSHEKGFCKGKNPGCCIAEILLTPGQNLDVESFVAHLYDAEYAANTLCSPSVSHDLLVQLSQNPNKQIADAAQDLLEALRAATKRGIRDR
jgi:hypothetical protein